MWLRSHGEQTRRGSRGRGVRWAALLAAVWLVGCAAAQHISRGDDLAAKGKYQEAIAAFQKALRVSPGNSSAEEGIRDARREAVRAVLVDARQKLQKGEYAAALADGMRARRMPLDLDEVELAGDIDEAISRASRRAEDKVQQWSEAGLFLLAVELADQVARASPSESRTKWAAEVKAKAAEHYGSLAGQLTEGKLPGSAAMQLAMAKRIGTEVESARVSALWDEFTEPICFAQPAVTIEVSGAPGGEVAAIIERAAIAELDALRQRCGEGTRPLGVVIELTDLSVVDEKETSQAAKALPGSGVETVEVYYEERPYTVEEEVTEYETRIEKQERRDCAPRPGKPRGCQTWVEDVEVTVPVKRMKEVRKVERIKKTRPAKGPFPPDEVVTFEITTVTRKIKFMGSVAVVGAEGEPRQLEVSLESSDSANAEVQHPKMLVAADPMEVKEMPELVAEAGGLVSAELRKGVSAAVAQWSRADSELARKRVLEGQLPQAEELYLRLIALGATDDPNLGKFFRDRYGRAVGTVMDYLLQAMGHTTERRRPGDTESVSGFPKRGSGKVEEERVVAPTEAQVEEEKSEGTDQPDVSTMADEELRALEEASFDENNPRPEAPAESGVPVEGGVPAEDGTPAEGGAPAEDGTPVEGGAPAEGGAPVESAAPAEGGAATAPGSKVEPGSGESGTPAEPAVPDDAKGDPEAKVGPGPEAGTSAPAKPNPAPPPEPPSAETPPPSRGPDGPKGE